MKKASNLEFQISNLTIFPKCIKNALLVIAIDKKMWKILILCMLDNSTSFQKYMEKMKTAFYFLPSICILIRDIIKGMGQHTLKK